MLPFIVLGMLYQCALTGYEIKKLIDDGVGTFYKTSYSSIYPVLKQLSDKGFVIILTEHYGARLKKRYEITPKGREHFLKWLGEPLSFDDGSLPQSHLARVYFFDALPPDVARQHLLAYELSNTQHLNRLLELERTYNNARVFQNHYFKLSTLYYSITTLRAIIQWCQHVRSGLPFTDFPVSEPPSERDKYCQNTQ